MRARIDSRMSSVIVDQYRPEDRPEVNALFRRVFGDSAADASAARWDWQYRQNPNARTPQIWIARDEGRIVGQYATMPVRLRIKGEEIDGSWGMDVMVAPERQRKGVGEILFRTWDRHTGASLGMGLSTSSHQLFRKLRWPDVGPVPCLVKPISPRAFARTHQPSLVNGLVSLAARPLVVVLRSRRAANPAVRPIREFDARFTDLWERVSSKFSFAVRRDADYLQWKYIALPYIRYNVVALDHGSTVEGYAVFRHIDTPGGRITALVDLLADPGDREALAALLSAVERDSRAAGSNKIRAFVMNAAFRNAMRGQGYFPVRSTIDLVVKVNAVPVGPDFYEDRAAWHVMFGDSDQDR
jgi:GNAT superfamily N-acetyltransferase